MTTFQLSSRSREPPQLPPFRPLSFYPSQLGSMALTGLDFTTVSSQSSGMTTTTTKLDQRRPLPQPPQGEADAQPLQRPPQLRQQLLSAQAERLSIDLNDVAESSTRPRRTTSYRPASGYFWASNNESSFLTALNDPRTLHSILGCLEWPDAYALFITCKKLCESFHILPLRDAILSRFVPGYTQCLRDRDIQFYQDVPVTLQDLDRLLISQRVPLHRYPIHALRVLQILYPSLEDDHLRNKFAALAQVHSRFVLLLQSMVHSSSASMPQESEEGAYRPRFSPIQSLRELTFPAPLAYSEPQTPRTSITLGIANSKLSKHTRHRSAPTGVSTQANSARAWSLDLPRSPHTSADAASTMISAGSMKKPRRLSIFGRKASRRMAPPPPPDEPRALKMYSSTWRKSLAYPPQNGYDVREDGVLSDLKRFRISTARQPITSFRNDSSDSSSLSPSRSRNSMAISNANSDPKPTSQHDLIHAVSRNRAPILRVFVPCTRLDADSESLARCEMQLVSSGLWEHLSTGDVVCNLGYVSPLEGSTPSAEGHDEPSPLGGEFVMMRPNSRARSSPFSGGPNGTHPSNGQKWLIFNGQHLVPYSIPEVLPLSEPLNLPTPFYYAHIMPPLSNPSFAINRLPVCDDVPQLALMHSSKKVPSPHSPNGYAMVKKYSWTARVVRLKTEADQEMGAGWFGEWVLEGEGTPEGKRLLLAALRGYDLGYREWELVREKSGAGKLWLRLLTL